MKTILTICLILATLSYTFATITEAQLNQYYEECFDKVNHPDYEEDESEYDYECDANCKQLLDTYIQDVKDINSKQAVKPCDEWWAYQQSAEYDSSNLDGQLLFKYQYCLEQLITMNTDTNQQYVLDCVDEKIDIYFDDNSISEEDEDEFEKILQADDINQCKSQCSINIDCDEDCQTFINENFDQKIGDCDYIDFDYTYDELDDYDSEGYMQCYIENAYKIKAFQEARQQIDLKALYNTATKENNYTIDYSTLSNLEAKQKAFLTLDCQIQCYDYFHLYGYDDYVFEQYDNRHAILELYGEEKFDEYFYQYSKINYDYDFQFFKDFVYKKFFQLGCHKDNECFDENGHLIEVVDGIEENSCDTEYCFVEFYECIDQCQQEQCYFDTCYDRTKGQGFNYYIQDICVGLHKLKYQYDGEDIDNLLDVTTPQYIETFSDCVTKLQEYEENNTEREESDKKIITDMYTCLATCKEEKEPLDKNSEDETEDESEKEKNENDGEGSQSRLILTLGTVILSFLLLI